MNKIFVIVSLLLIPIIIYIYPRILEIYKPVDKEKITWYKIFDLKTLDKAYVAQGIEVFEDYLFYTVHKKDEESHLLVFKINQNKSLKHLFTTEFPKVATHVSDLSIYNNFLYAIDYASNNLYKIDILKTIDTNTLIIKDTIPTHIPKSGSIIVTNYKGNDIIFISQFMLEKNIKVYNLNDVSTKNKSPIFEIESKYFIQGLYKKNNKILITSNTNKIDPIFITNKSVLFETKALDNNTTVAFNGPGNMIEDIVLYKEHIITSDEETNQIYISKETITSLLKKNK